MLLYIIVKLAAHLTKLGGLRLAPGQVRKLGKLVLGDLEKECVHHALAEMRTESRTPAFARLLKLSAVAALLLRSVYPIEVELEAVVPIGGVEDRHTVISDGDLSAVHDKRFHCVIERARLVRARDAVMRVEEPGVPRKHDIAVNRLNEPERVVGALSRLLALVVEIVVCVSHFVHVFRPARYHIARKGRIPHRRHVIKGCVHILDLSEADLTERLLRPCKRARDE